MTQLRKAQLIWFLAKIPVLLLASLLFQGVLWTWSLDCFLYKPVGASFPASYIAASIEGVPALMLNLCLLGFLTFLVWLSVIRLLPIAERMVSAVSLFAMVILLVVDLVVFKLGVPWDLGSGFLGDNATFECFRSFLAEWLSLGALFVLPRILIGFLRPGVFLRLLRGSPAA